MVEDASQQLLSLNEIQTIDNKKIIDANSIFKIKI
jgi:hypothetical protein